VFLILPEFDVSSLKLQYQKDKEEMIKHKTLHIILQIEIPKGKPESVETKDRKYNGQKDRQCKGQKDSQYKCQKDKQL
jgi:hypothetical protein